YGLTHLQRLRQLGMGISASSPFSRFNRLEFGIEGSYVELADIYQQLIPGTNETQYVEDILMTLETLVPRVSYVWDNTRWFQTYPVTGTRLYTSFEFSPRFAGTGLDFRTISLDARNYHKLFSGISFAGRLYAGQSYGRNANIFRVGGVPWLFSSEKSYYGENPYTDYNNYQDVLQGMYFTKYVMPVRGAQINELHGNTAIVANAEIRLPFLIYYFPTIKFIGQINMVFFSDFGMAWMGSKPQMWEGKSWDSNPQDFIWTYGFGPRFIFLGMPWQLDYAWEINPVQKVKRMWYLSIGLDF
ncbi:MAG: BamA/TamA family outer membrane protein, partial [FCB group bacterium]|nr:BamA/TamA family outer membrane protein [FCB group bacterium]